MELDRFYKACNPSKTLVAGDPGDYQYYIDFASVRGGKIIESLQRTITRISPDQPTCQLFTGHIGCGKSTELFRLKAELEQEGFYVVYFESSQDLDMGDVDISDILLSIARQVSETMESAKIKLRPSYFTNLFAEVAEFLQTPIDLSAEAELSVGIARVTAKTKDSPKLRSQLRQYLEPRTNSILQSINEELLNVANLELKRQGKKGLAVIVDNLDRLDGGLKPSGRTQPEYLFLDRGEQLKKLNCHVVYTIPLTLIFSNDFGRLASRFGVKPKVMPMVPVQIRSGQDHSEGMALLRQLVLARAFPKVAPSQRLDLISKVFDSPETLDRLCRISGGHVRNLLMLLYSCLQHEDPPFTRECLESVIQEYRDDLLGAVNDTEWELLFQVVNRQTVTGEEESQILLRSMFVFEYRDPEGRWFGINPALAETRKYKEWQQRVQQK
ncbi:MAG: ATP-binding protein [Oscillatoriales cyanobacterium]|nr:MAG: ATP-binding protein [Oscillatoriales cyanobacterium]TAE05718.1 MAG: ATP-binding protein [Oscillatoriales cyanobacterium]TAF03646.1 MAG: ATP-binding protein [Oscillatoriales cyanobacterium]TAF47544.1 MAG: ATP-binding protein [Oscillatoriales cyanobacterium]TAF69434.1 MAG: ATP-binding protein [Oscillatoriales cyanobacterium]